MVKQYMFMRSVLEFIGRGDLFCRIFSGAVRLLVVLLILGALVAWIHLWKLVFQLEGMGLLGGILIQALFVAAVYMVVHVLVIRAVDIDALGGSQFVVIPIVSVLLRMLGEVYACICVALGIGGAILYLFAGYTGLLEQIIQAIPGAGLQRALVSGPLGWAGGSSFVSAVLLAVGGALAAVLWLVVFYLASELVVAIVDIARNTRALREVAERDPNAAQRVEPVVGGAAVETRT